MTFNPNVPNPGDLLSVSQGDLKANNAALNASFGRNHVPFAIATNNGKHNFIEMPINAALPAPVPGLSAGEGTLYTKASGESSLFYTPGATGNEYQLTRTITASFARFGTNTPYTANHAGGWTFLPGGMLLQYGLRSSPGTSGVITFPIAFTNAPYSISVSNYRTSAQSVSVDSGTPATTTNFSYQANTAGSVGIYWWAIGV